MVNKAILVGHLGADPETRTTGNGLVIANLRVATDSRRKSQDGTWIDETEWHRVVAFGKLAELCVKYLVKGRGVYIEGKIKTRKWQDKDGQDRWSTEILADQVQFLSGGGERSTGTSERGSYSENQADADIPF